MERERTRDTVRARVVCSRRVCSIIGHTSTSPCIRSRTLNTRSVKCALRMRPVEWIKCFASVFFVISISIHLLLLLRRLLLLFPRFHHFLSLFLFIPSHSIVSSVHAHCRIWTMDVYLCICSRLTFSFSRKWRTHNDSTIIIRVLNRPDERPTDRVSVTCLWPPYCALFIYSWFRYYNTDIIVDFVFIFRFDFSISYGMTFLCTMLWGSHSSQSASLCVCVWVGVYENVFSVHSICPNMTLKINTLFLLCPVWCLAASI